MADVMTPTETVTHHVHVQGRGEYAVIFIPLQQDADWSHVIAAFELCDGGGGLIIVYVNILFPRLYMLLYFIFQ